MLFWIFVDNHAVLRAHCCAEMDVYV